MSEIILPEIGEGVIEGTIARWLKAEGDEVEEFEPLLEVETDKVTTEIVAESSGTLQKILVSEGSTVEVGTVLAVLDDGQPAADDAAETESEPEPAAAKLQPDLQAKSEKIAAAADTQQETARRSGAADGPVNKTYTRRHDDLGWVSPVVARMAQQHNLDLTQIEGTGRNNRITKRDVEVYLEAQPAAQPAKTADRSAVNGNQPPQAKKQTSSPSAPQSQRQKPQPAASFDIPATSELVPLSGMRRSIAQHMVASKQTSPHVTTVFEADFSAVTAHRKTHKPAFAEKGVRLTFTPYLVMAIAQALADHPLANSSWHDDGIVLHKQVHVGMATALEEGLMVPVIRNADEKNLLGLARSVNDLAQRTRAGKLTADELKGGTFTLTNHGVSGSLFATPIINQPQCGILGAGAIQKRVVVITDEYGNDSMTIRPMTYLSFTFDHRILDGATADAFVAQVKQTIEQWPQG